MRRNFSFGRLWVQDTPSSALADKYRRNQEDEEKTRKRSRSLSRAFIDFYNNDHLQPILERPQISINCIKGASSIRRNFSSGRLWVQNIHSCRLTAEPCFCSGTRVLMEAAKMLRSSIMIYPQSRKINETAKIINASFCSVLSPHRTALLLWATLSLSMKPCQ